MPTPTENRAKANQMDVQVELTDGRKFTAVRWYEPEAKPKWQYQVAIDGQIFDLKAAGDGKYELV